MRQRCTPAVTRTAWLVCLGLATVAAMIHVPSSPPAHAGWQPREDDLPWSEKAGTTPVLPPGGITGARQMLQMLGIDQSQLNAFEDRQPLGVNDQETLIKCLFRVPRFSAFDLQQWRRSDLDWAQLLDQPELFRGDVVRLEGQAIHATRVPLPPELAPLYDFEDYFQVQLELDDAPYTVLLCTRDVPDIWLGQNALRQPAAADALFLKVGDTTGPRVQLVCMAPRVAWYPAQPAPDLQVDADLVRLANHRCDIGLVQRLATLNRLPIRSQDRECFYQMLRAVAAADAQASEPAPALPLGPLLQDAERHHGQRYSFQGRARRITKVRVEEVDVMARFGLDHYYQIDFFLPLGRQVVQLQDKNRQATGAVFRNTFPMTLCALQLPDELMQQLNDEGNAANINLPIRVSGHFFKLWSYRSQYIGSIDQAQRQVSPMFLIAAPQVETTDRSESWLGIAIGAAFVVILAAAWWGVWHFHRADQKFEREVAHQQRLPEKPLDQLQLPEHQGPDFSNLP